MECKKCNSQMVELEALGEEVLSFFKKDGKEENRAKFSLNIGGKKIGDDVIHGRVDKAYYCEECGYMMATIKKEDF
ncbi:hypothetical protein P7M27_25220, partial [Vibrio parahaemolyticus]|nr:hypothetical protein [Tissierellales bacterium]MDG2860963.1 hypothetical protein [Vibrio parahaemolyticus]